MDEYEMHGFMHEKSSYVSRKSIILSGFVIYASEIILKIMDEHVMNP